MNDSDFAIIVFRAKTDVFSLIVALNSYGVAASTTGTPKEARIGCGIAVKTEVRAIGTALEIINGGGYDSFYGIYRTKTAGGRTSRTRVI